MCLEQQKGEFMIFNFWLNYPYNAPMTSRRCISAVTHWSKHELQHEWQRPLLAFQCYCILHISTISLCSNKLSNVWNGRVSYTLHSTHDLTSCLIQLSPDFISDINVIFWIKVQEGDQNEPLLKKSGLTFAVNLWSQAQCIVGYIIHVYSGCILHCWIGNLILPYHYFRHIKMW